MGKALTVSVFCALSWVTAAPSVADPVQLNGRHLDLITVAGDNIAGWVVEEKKKEGGHNLENSWSTRSPSQDLDEASSTTIVASPDVDTILFEINGLEEAKPRETASITLAAPMTALQEGINAGINNGISQTVDDANINALSSLSNAAASLSVDTGTVASVDAGTVASATASALAVNGNGGGAISVHRTSTSESIKTSENGRATASASSMSMSSNSLFTATNAATRLTPALSRSGRF